MRVAALLLSVLWVSCGVPLPAIDGGAGGGGAAATGGGGGGATGGGAGADAGAPGVLRFIMTRGFVTGAGGVQRTFRGGLGWRRPDAGTAAVCDVITDGACTRRQCPSISGPLPDVPPNAGDVTATGSTRSVSWLREDAGLGYDLPIALTSIFEPGEAVHLVAAGGDEVPAFALDLVTPSEPTVEAPAPDGVVHLLVTDTEFALSAAPEGASSLGLSQEVDGGVDGVSCSWPAGTAQLVVPRSMWIGRTGTASLTVSHTTRVSTRAGDYTVSLEATTPLLLRDGGTFVEAVFE